MKRSLLMIALAVALGTPRAEAGGLCGCDAGPKYRCRLVCTMKSELTYEYAEECKPYCNLGPSDKCGKKRVCDDSFFGFHWETIWKPSCECKVRTKNTLVKIPVVKQVPVYSCVVEQVCGDCGRCHVDAAATQRLHDAGIMPVSAAMPVVDLDGSLRPIRHPEATTFAPPPVPERDRVETR